MTMRKPDLHPDNHPEGVRSDLDPNRVLLIDGEVANRELFEDTPTQAAIDAIENMPLEQVYIGMLRRGGARVPAIEARIDMTRIPPELLEGRRIRNS